MKRLDVVAEDWIDKMADDGIIGHYRESQAKALLSLLLVEVRHEALSVDAAAAEAHENEACALLVDSLLGTNNKVSELIRMRTTEARPTDE